VRVETHLYVCLNEDDEPVRAYHDRGAAWDAVESDNYADETIVDVWPDIPIMEGDR
jgi:hypothetical protein